MDSLNDDGAVVELRRKYHPGDGDGGWTSRSASRMGAVRRQGMSLTLPTRRHAMYDDQTHHDPSGHRATSDGRMHPEAPGGSTLNTSNGGADNSDDDNDDDEFLEFSSDDDEIYANTSEIELQKRDKVRRHVVEELVSTEQSYIDKLRFLKTMKEQLESMVNSLKFVIPLEDVDKIFPLIDSLYKLHNETLLPAFRLALRNWSAQSSIGYVFLIHAPKLQMYEQYIKASPRSVRTLETWRKKDPDFNKLVTLFQQNTAANNIDILDIIHEPYIKLQRWKLLLQRYKQHLPPSNTDCKDIPRIMSKFDAILQNCEDALKQAENLDRLLGLEKKIEGLIVFLSSDTQFINDVPVVEIDPRGMRICLNPTKRNKTPRHLLLFNDMILLCKAKQKSEKLSVRSKIPLLTGKLLPADYLVKLGYEADRCFILQSTKMAFYLLFASSSEKEQWETLIRTAQHNAGQRKSIRQNLADTSCSDFTCAPIWLPDNAADSCMLCCREFNVVCWRHHCRGCGIIMCSHCSPGKLRLPYNPSSPVIVCRTCYMRARRFFAHLVLDADTKDSACDVNGSAITLALDTRFSSFVHHGTEEDV